MVSGVTSVHVRPSREEMNFPYWLMATQRVPSLTMSHQFSESGEVPGVRVLVLQS